jgi:UDPglucose 6-dehydrogenase
MFKENEGKAQVGIIGLGAVGSAVRHALSFYHSSVGYDIKGEGSWNEILKTQAVFICVSTPEGEDGRLDCSAVDDVLSRLEGSNYSGICVIKSTVGVGYTDSAARRFPRLRLIYMPEFLREKSNFTWFVNPDRVVISGQEHDVDEVLELFTWVDGLDETVPVLRMSHIDAEIGKLAHNAYIATKVGFTEEIEKISREHGADPNQVMSVIHADRRVKSREHLRPGLGPYGGTCVPKDTRELINASHAATLLRVVESVNENAKDSQLIVGTKSAVRQPAENRTL